MQILERIDKMYKICNKNKLIFINNFVYYNICDQCLYFLYETVKIILILFPNQYTSVSFIIDAYQESININSFLN